MSAGTTMLGSVLTSFFNDHLKLRKGLRPKSITSYADAIRLFLQFTAKTAGKKITQLGLDDLDAGAVSSFLNPNPRCAPDYSNRISIHPIVYPSGPGLADDDGASCNLTY